jgi:acetylornithine/succinyldiaminopimelate/putrescine aminotransferase
MKKHTDWLEKVQTINSTTETRKAALKLAKAKTTHELATAERSLVAVALTQLARQLAEEIYAPVGGKPIRRASCR